MHPQPPAPDEYASFYRTYVSLVETEPLLPTLEQGLRDTTALFRSLSEEDASFRYAPGKWSVKEVLGHMTDTERVMTFRALCFARGETAALPGFDENLYVEHAAFDRCSLEDLVEGFSAVRKATLHLFRTFDAAAWQRRGVSNGREVSVRALGYIVAGHERHHRRVLAERYGLGAVNA